MRRHERERIAIQGLPHLHSLACLRLTTNTKRQKRRKIKQSQVNGLADARRKEIEGDDGNGGLKKEISDLKMRSRVAQDELVSARSIPPR